MNVKEKIILAGFGGQGILSIGRILAEACMEKGLNASWMPSYGPEMRGGTCNCKVVVSDDKILSPIFTRPTKAIIMNRNSLDRFMDKLDKAEIIVLNSSLIDLSEEDKEKLKDTKLICVDANELALEAGSIQCANMVMIGAYTKHSKAIDLEQIKESIKERFKDKPKVVEMNLKSIDMGYAQG